MSKFKVVRLTEDNADSFREYIGQDNVAKVAQPGYYGNGVEDENGACGAILLFQPEGEKTMHFISGRVSAHAEEEGAGEMLRRRIGESLSLGNIEKVELPDGAGTDIDMYLPRLTAVAAVFTDRGLDARVCGTTGEDGVPYVSVSDSLISVNFFLSIDGDDFEKAFLIATTAADDTADVLSRTGEMAALDDGIYRASLPMYGGAFDEVVWGFYTEFVYEVLYGGDESREPMEEEKLNEAIEAVTAGLDEAGYSPRPYMEGDTPGVMLMDDDLSRDEDGIAVDPVTFLISPLKAAGVASDGMTEETADEDWAIIPEEEVVMLTIRRHVSFTDEGASQTLLNDFYKKKRIIGLYVDERDAFFSYSFPISVHDSTFIQVLDKATDTLITESDDTLK